MHVSIDISEAKQLARDLARYAQHALPYATRKALSAAAHEGRKEWTARLSTRLVLRNSFTARSLRVANARGTKIASMEAVLGSTAPYMGLQEFGGTVSGKGRSAPIPTSVAAGQSKGSRPRTKLVRRPNRMGSIELSKVRARKSMSRKQRNAIAMRVASRGNKVALLELDGGRRGLFRVTGRGRRLTEPRMLWDLSHRSTKVPARGMLQSALKSVGPRMPIISQDALLEQLRRNKVLGY